MRPRGSSCSGGGPALAVGPAHFSPTLADRLLLRVNLLLCASLPPVATDEMIHHLAVPRQMLEAGGTVPFPDNIYAYFPPLGEMLFLLGSAWAERSGPGCSMPCLA